MRSLGIVQLGSLVLGPAPSAIAPEDPESAKERERSRRREEFRRDYDLEFGHVGTCPFTDDQIDRYLRGEARL